MSVESQVFDALKGLCANRVYPDIAPDVSVRPYITYQKVGGVSVNFMEGGSPSKANTRMQINVWGDTRASVALLAKQASDALRAAPGLQTVALGEPVATYEMETKLRGSMQDFSFWTAP